LMIEGQRQGLDLERQLLLSRWATKTAAVWEQLVPAQHRYFTHEDCRWIMEQPTPPPGTTVRLGHYTGTDAEFIEHKREGLWKPPAYPKDSVPPDGHRAIMLIGELIIMVAVGAGADKLSIIGGNTSLSDVLMPIWPTVEARSWPPRVGTTHKTLESLHEPSEPG
jgi:hypothetical protein